MTGESATGSDTPRMRAVKSRKPAPPRRHETLMRRLLYVIVLARAATVNGVRVGLE